MEVEIEEVYIKFLNKDKGFREDKKCFKSWDAAKIWGMENLSNFNMDMINYK
jgi:hypothetical protein